MIIDANYLRIAIYGSAYNAKELQDEIAIHLEDIVATYGHYNIMAHRMRDAAKLINDAIWSLEECARHFAEIAKEDEAKKKKGGE